MRLRRTVTVVALAAVCAALLGACKKEQDQKNVVNDAITATEQTPRKFVYVDNTKSTKTQVAGLFEDDFRFKARLTINGTPVQDEIDSDDALAVRFIAPEQLGHFLTAASVLPSSGGGGTINVPPTVAALATRHWVLDPVGAPPVQVSASDQRKQGDDQIHDAVSVLEYVRAAVTAAVQVKKYSPDDVEPVFRPNEDPFPRPPRGSKTLRYDLRAPSLPTLSTGAVGGSSGLPDITNFRKMVVYVRDKKIIEVREIIDVASQLSKLISGFRLPHNTTVSEVVDAINQVRRGRGLDPIRVRTMDLQFQGLGDQLRVDLPTDAVQGSLTVLRYRGRAQTQSPSA